jgi:hypothetical protein
MNLPGGDIIIDEVRCIGGKVELDYEILNPGQCIGPESMSFIGRPSTRPKIWGTFQCMSRDELPDDCPGSTANNANENYDGSYGSAGMCTDAYKRSKSAQLKNGPAYKWYISSYSSDSPSDITCRAPASVYDGYPGTRFNQVDTCDVWCKSKGGEWNGPDEICFPASMMNSYGDNLEDTGCCWMKDKSSSSSPSKTFGSCSSDSDCASGTCKGGECCRTESWSYSLKNDLDQCNSCDADGYCSSCAENYIGLYSGEYFICDSCSYGHSSLAGSTESSNCLKITGECGSDSECIS